MCIYFNSQAEYDGEWHDVPSVMGSLLVMTGSLISELSDNQIPALVHRSLSNSSLQSSCPIETSRSVP